MGLEQKTGDDAEVSTTAAQSPEKIRTSRPAGGNKCAIGQNHISLNQTNNSEAILATAVAATKGKSRDPGRGDDAEGNCKPERMGGVINIACHAAGSYP